jgi:hypothetical protein
MSDGIKTIPKEAHRGVPPVVDWKEVLIKYICQVGRCEGTDFIEDKNESFSPEENAALLWARDKAYDRHVGQSFPPPVVLAAHPCAGCLKYHKSECWTDSPETRCYRFKPEKPCRYFDAIPRPHCLLDEKEGCRFPNCEKFIEDLDD